MIGLFSNPLAMLLIAALAFGWVQTLQLDSAQEDAKAQNAALATCNAKTNLQNQRIEMFKEEARIMGENLAKRRAEAAKLRSAGDKKARAIMAEPSKKTCEKAIGAAVRDIQERYKNE